MSTVLEEFVGKLGWQVDKAGPAEFKKQASGIGKGLAVIGAAYAAVTGFVTNFVVKTNAATAANYRLAQGMGVSYDWLDRWGDAGKAAGIGVDSIRGAMGYLNKTIGAGNSAGVNKALADLGLSFEEIKNSSPEDAFNKAAFAIGNTEDRTIAANAAAKLFGRGAGQNFARLGEMARANGQTVEEYLNRFKDLKFETGASVKGAVAFTQSWGAIAFAVDEVKAAFAGLIGEALTPMLKDVRGWIAANRGLLKQKIVEWARGVAKWLKDVWGFVSKIAGSIGSLIAKVGGLSSVLKILVMTWLGSKFLSATSNVDKLSFSLDKAKIKAGLLKAGLLAVAAIAFDDLLSSLDDISNESWGNRIARKLLWVQDKAMIWAAEMMGIFFKSDADRANFIAAQMGFSTALMSDLVTNLGIWIENAKNVIARGAVAIKGAWALVTGGADPKKVSAAMAVLNEKYKPIEYVDTTGKYTKAMANATSRGQDKAARDKAAGQAPVTSNNSVFNIYPSPGMNEEDLARKVNKHLEKAVKGAVRNAQAGGAKR